MGDLKVAPTRRSGTADEEAGGPFTAPLTLTLSPAGRGNSGQAGHFVGVDEADGIGAGHLQTQNPLHHADHVLEMPPATSGSVTAVAEQAWQTPRPSGRVMPYGASPDRPHTEQETSPAITRTHTAATTRAARRPLTSGFPKLFD